MLKGWIATSLDAENNPYEDRRRTTYAYNSNVQNHRRVRAGDVLLIRDDRHLLGVGRIKRIDTSTKEMEFHRCAACNSRRIHERSTRQPRFRCHNGHEFDIATSSKEDVLAYQAHFDGDYVDITVPIAVEEVRPFNQVPGNQLSLMPTDLGGLSGFIASRDETAFAQLSIWTTTGATNLADLEALEDDYTPDGKDERELINSAIRARRGQQPFRERLLTRYGNQCVITGSGVTAVLEAAHIRPYRGPKDNHSGNGLILRADIHTLFDLDKIGIDPETLTVSIQADLRGTEYGAWHGTKIRVQAGSRPSRAALEYRWKIFESGKSLEGRESGSQPFGESLTPG